jgi:sugar phosphate isomerase/epimerase
MKLGVDSYSFHRLFGDVRGAEAAPSRRFSSGNLDVIAVAERVGAESVSLQTCFLELPSAPGAEALRDALAELELVVAWGHPEGLAFGYAAGAADDLDHWIAAAPTLGCKLVRLVAGNSGTERGGRPLASLAAALERHVDLARRHGVLLALENHADLTVSELEHLLGLVDDPVLGICLDTANALRVGDDPLEATMRLLPHMLMLHLKDVAGRGFEPTVGPQSVAYGTGVVPVGEIMTALASDGFDGHVLVELGYLGAGDVDEEELVRVCFEWLVEARQSQGGAGSDRVT